MLTVEKLRVWEEFHGDRDIFGRVDERRLKGVTWDDWHEIEVFVADLRMMSNVAVAESFAHDFERRIAELVADDEARQMLRRLAEEPWP